MTENRTTTPEAETIPSDAATTDALDSVTTTEQIITPDPAAEELASDDAASTSDDTDSPDDASSSDDVLASTSEVETSDDTDTSDVGVGAPFGEEEGVLSGVEVVVDDATMRRALEAILMVTDEPLPALTLARTVGRPTGDVTNALNELAGEYTEQGRGFDLREVGGGWRYYTRADAAQYVERFVLDGQQSRLTQAALETLAVVAYKQPVSRARVSAIRGVNVDGVMRTLISRGLVEEAGADTESQATLYRTTSYFLERMGMQSLDDLPELAPYLPDMDDMEEELAAQNTTPEAETVQAEAESEDAVEAVAEDGGPEEELEPAEELEAGGDEIETAADPAEIPAGEEDADGNDDDDESADFDAAVGDLDEDDEDEDDDLAIDAIEDVDAADDDDDDLDEDDESVDERLEAAEDLELAGVPDESDDEPVAGGSQYGTEANERDE
ncbi:SMC-Scp complex subunit ScpB [Kribbella sp. NPDC006257]|uniref:SMC-Scp complex subunit ScpB n=1 Tax=Kribbella sp. NPDC006257 TaxID=3156738 RepID=UPI0033AA7C26